MATEYHRKYRPETFEEVLGQDAVVKSIKTVLAKNSAHAFLLHGPSGCGKTTLARIIAKEVGCDARNIREIDAATHSGADNMREEQQVLQYLPFGNAKARAVIIDECHSLSKQAWQTLLKGTEEPNAHVYWFFCTTDFAKVPKTIVTRCARYQLNDVPSDALSKLLRKVCKLEKITLAEGVDRVILKAAKGSPRQLLVNLAACEDCATPKNAAMLLDEVIERDTIIELCRALASGSTWVKVMSIYEAGLKEQNPEAVRIVACNYFGKMAAGARSNDQALRALKILDAFSGEYNPSEKQAPLMLSIGRAILD